MSMSSFQPMQTQHDDVVALVCNWLRPKVPPGVTVGRMVTDARPSLQVQRSGGPVDGLVDAAELQFDVRAADWDEAFDIAAIVRGTLPLARLEIAEVVQSAEQSGLFELQDGDEPRLVFTWRVAVRSR